MYNSLPAAACQVRSRGHKFQDFTNYANFFKPALDISRELLIIVLLYGFLMEVCSVSSMNKDIQIESRGPALCINPVRTKTVFGVIIILMERRKPL